MTAEHDSEAVKAEAAPSPLTIRALLLGDRLDTSGLERREMIASTPFAFKVGQHGFVAFSATGQLCLRG